MIVARTLAGILLAASLSGCGTIMSKGMGGDWGNPYSGTACSATAIVAVTFGIPGGFLLAPFMLIDIPLSLVADTVLLPADLVMDERPSASSGCSLH